MEKPLTGAAVALELLAMAQQLPPLLGQTLQASLLATVLSHTAEQLLPRRAQLFIRTGESSWLRLLPAHLTQHYRTLGCTNSAVNTANL